MKQEVRERIERAHSLARLQKMRTSVSKSGPKRDYASTLEFIARPFGGRQAMIDLARGCSDCRIRRMVRCWDRLGGTQKRYTSLAELCEVHGIGEGDFLGAVIATLWRSGVDATALMRRCFKASAGRRAALDAQAAKTVEHVLNGPQLAC